MQVGTMDEIELSAKGRSLKLRPVNDRWIELSASVRGGWLPLGAESPEYVVARLISLLTGELAVESDPTWVMSLSEDHFSMYACRLRDRTLRLRWQDAEANWDPEAVFDLTDRDVSMWLARLSVHHRESPEPQVGS